MANLNETTILRLTPGDFGGFGHGFQTSLISELFLVSDQYSPAKQ